jgi:CrcB protein
MAHWFSVGLGGFVGALARFALSRWLNPLLGPAFPLGTLSVNVLGSFALGFLLAWLQRPQGGLPPHIATGLGTGALGAFTTMSTFANETRSLLGMDQGPKALVYVAATLIGCMAAAFLGHRLGQG